MSEISWFTASRLNPRRRRAYWRILCSCFRCTLEACSKIGSKKLRRRSSMRDAGSVDIPSDILELVTNHGNSVLPLSGDLYHRDSVAAVRLRAYWGRLRDLAQGRTADADRWLGAYNWA